ncbi:MAG: molybdopterin-guanine dinucleotide biosynthesis protein B, partial [Hyphomicrobiales bacterium]
MTSTGSPSRRRTTPASWPERSSRRATLNMPPIVSIVGRSESGKTTLIEKLIPELRRRGYRIGTIKHTHHAF